MQSPSASAIPNFYYVLFAFFEPMLTTIGFFTTVYDPKSALIAQAPWPANSPPPAVLPNALTITIVQLAHVCALMGLLNIFILSAARNHLAAQPALQEKIVRALLTPLIIGDVLHIYLTLWALGDDRWDIARWTPVLWATTVLGICLLIPRAMWHLGMWRYVDARDRVVHPSNPKLGSQPEKK